jgi:DnaJ-class molecular chaperone
MAQCPGCSGNGTVTLDQYNDGEFREGLCMTCEGRGSIPLQQYLLDIREEGEVGA